MFQQQMIFEFRHPDDGLIKGFIMHGPSPSTGNMEIWCDMSQKDMGNYEANFYVAPRNLKLIALKPDPWANAAIY